MIFNSEFNFIVIVQGSFNPFKSGNLETNGTCLRIILFSTISAFLERGGGNNRSALIFSTHCQVQFSKREFIYFLNNIRTKKIIVLC